ncbi:hypothetical protein [Propionicimonas sp.]|uniref:hypothetical protein n=1 Tax=Propionicimonas sp. TaxID=1955623 RepID=UPI0039E614A8
MTRESGSWLVSAGLLAAAAAGSLVALTRYWQPCAGSIGAISFTDGCLVAMDEYAPPLIGQDPASLVGALGLAASLASAAAWLVVLPTIRAGVAARALLALPGLAAVAVAVWSATLAPGADGVPGWTLVLLDLLVLPAALALAALGLGGARLVRYVLVLLAATSAGVVHQVVDLTLALGLNQASWDSPPGSGVPTALAILATAIATLVLWRTAGRAQSPTASLPRDTSSGSGSPTIAVSLPS